MKIGFITILLFMLPLSCFAQVVIEGTVYDKSKKPQSGVSVTLNNPKTDGVINYMITDNDGYYRFSYSGVADSLSVSVSGFNISKQEKRIRSTSHRLDFTIDLKAIELKEVIIKSNPIYGTRDTINYAVAAFLSEEDTVIEDVIKKLPGVSVDNSGKIKYQGKDLSKFYIEDMDLLEGRYGIATKNISAYDIQTIQILENHQPIKALSDIRFSDQAAMNIKLKQEKKGVFMLNAKAGLGADDKLRWNNLLTGMYFGRKRQDIILYKGNNSGENLSGEFSSHTAMDHFGNQNLLNITIPSAPSININRYLFNNTNAVSVNELRKTKSDNEIKLNLIYLNDHINRHGRSRSSFYIPGEDMMVLDEDITSAIDINKLEAELKYNINDDKKYLNNLTEFKGMWENALGHVITADDIMQRAKKPTVSVVNQFNLIRTNSKNKGFNMAASAGFKNAPQTLKINQPLYPDQLNNSEQPYYGIRQNLDMQKAYAHINGSLLSLFSLGNIRFDPTASFNAQYSTLISDLFLQDAAGYFHRSSDANMGNDLVWVKASANIGFEVHYTLGGFNLDISLPVAYSYFRISDHKNSEIRNLNRLFFQPSVRFRYALHPQMTLSGHYGLNNSTGDIQSIYNGYILQNYRSINRYDGQLPESTFNGGGLSWEYKNLIKMLFANIGIHYGNTKNNMLTKQTYEDVLIVTSRLPVSNHSENYGLNGNFSKGFDLWSMLFKLGGAYSQGASQGLRQGELLRYRYESMNFSGSFSMKPTKFLLLSYDGSWGRSSSWVSSSGKGSPISSSVQNVSLSIPVKKFLIKAGYEHYYNSASLGNKNFSFMDLGLAYHLKKNIEMNCELRNILNTKSFVTTNYYELNMYQNIYYIRPASIMFSIRFKIL